MSKVYMYGIDISEWQGNIDLTPYKSNFVIIRAGYGSHMDAKAKRNMDLCEKLGIPYGVYWYSYALNEKEARTEAGYCLEAIKGRKISVGVWFDMEDADKYKQKHGVTSASVITAMCNAFCEQIEKAGYYAGIYASASWFGTKINCPKYDKWVACWGTNNGKLQNDTSDMGSMHQYTSRPLDKNVIYVPLSTYTPKKEDKEESNKEKENTVKKTVPKKGEKWKIIRESGLYMYDKPSKSAEKIKRLDVGTVFTVHDTKVGKTSCFAKVKKDNKYGWVLAYDKNGVYCIEKSEPTIQDKIAKACKEQTKWSYSSIYEWESKPTIEKSKKKSTCVTYVACVYQRLGVLKSGEYIWHNGRGYGDGKVTGATKNFDIKYYNNKKSLKDIKKTLELGDVLMYDDSKSGVAGSGGHTEIYTGKDYSFYSGGTGSYHNTTNNHRENSARKVLAVCRPKKSKIK